MKKNIFVLDTNVLINEPNSILKFTNSNISVPVTILGGAGKAEHIMELVERCGIIGAASGSMCVFKGKFRAVLPSYISSHQRQQIYDSVNINR